MTIAFIPKLFLDEIPLFIVPDSISFDEGSAALVSQVITHGSQRKVTQTPDYTNSRGSVQFQIIVNASDNEQENPMLLFNKYKQKAISGVGSVIKILPETGVGGLIFTNMLLINTLNGSFGINAPISFNFEGNSAVILTS